MKLASSRKQLIVIVHDIPAGVQIWINLGHDHFLQLGQGGTLNDTFCRGPATGGSYELPKNGELPIAVTTTSETAPTEIKFKLLTSSDPCPKPLIIQPGLAIGPLHLGMTLHAADQAVSPRTKLLGPVSTPFGQYMTASYREGQHGLVITGFLAGRIAYLFVEGNQFETTTGIRALRFHNPFDERPELGPLFIVGSTLGQFGEKNCRALGSNPPPTRYCWHQGPSNRYTVAIGFKVNPCPNDPDGNRDGDVDVPPCTFPVDDYIFGLAVATHRGFEALQTLAGQFKP